MKHEQPEIFQHTAYFLDIKSYILHQLLIRLSSTIRWHQLQAYLI